jgi:hypothetical protein
MQSTPYWALLENVQVETGDDAEVIPTTTQSAV